MTWRAPPFAEDRIPPSHPHPFDGQAGTFGGATRGVGMTSAPGPGEKRPRKYHGWGVEVEFHYCISFESVCDKNFTNQSALFSSFSFSPSGEQFSDGRTTCAFRSDRRRRHPSSPFAHGLTRCWRCGLARSSL